MSISIGTEVWLRLTCDTGNKCKYQKDRGTVRGGWEGESEAGVFHQARTKGWIINGNTVICPDCAAEHTAKNELEQS